MSLQDRIIVKVKDFNPSKLSFREPRKMEGIGARFAGVEYDGKKLYLQTPEMSIPYGASQFKDPGAEEANPDAPWTLDLSFQGENENADVKGLREKLEQVRNCVLEAAHQNKWIVDKKNKDKTKRNKSVSKEVLNQMASQQIRETDKLDDEGNPKYPATMKVKLPCYKGNFGFSVYDSEKEAVDLESRKLDEILSKGCRGKCLLECGSVFIGATISLTWKMSQIIVKQSSRSLGGFAFIEDSDDEGVSEEKPSTKSASSGKGKKEAPTMVESDSDDSDEDSDDE
jgi:hypothetical protein